MLGREPTVPFDVYARCPTGHPLVIRNHPRSAQGDPFPTRYWLVCPEAVRAVSRLEAEGWIARLNERAEREPGFGEALERAHAAYAEERGRAEPRGRRWGGVGGTRAGVKCLHAHLAYHLAGGEDPVGAWVAKNVAPWHPDAASEPVAAVDLGTNSIRLLVAVPGGEGLTDLARDMVITRIGQDVDRTGRIAPEALERTVHVLERYVRRARALGATSVRVAATSAVREASNRADLAGSVQRVAGATLEVLTGEQEAAASFLGAIESLEGEPPFLVFDIGGGSTEFVLGDEQPRSSVSTDMGSVRLTERHVRSDPPAPQELEALREEADRFLREVEARVEVRRARTLVAVAGTATTVAALALELPSYDADRIHGSVLTLEAARSVLDRLAAMTTSQRAALAVMAPGRQDVIVAGAAILVRVMERFGFGSAVVSEHDVLDGLALQLARQPLT